MNPWRGSVVALLAALALAVAGVALLLKTATKAAWQPMPAAEDVRYTALAWDRAGLLRVGRQDGKIDLWDTAIGTVEPSPTPSGVIITGFLPVPDGYSQGSRPARLLVLRPSIDDGFSGINAAVFRDTAIASEGRLSGVLLDSPMLDFRAARDGIAAIAGPAGQEILILGDYGRDSLSLLPMGNLITATPSVARLDANLSAIASSPDGRTLVLGHRDPGRVQVINMPVDLAELPVVAEAQGQFTFTRDTVPGDVLPGDERFTPGPAVVAVAAARSREASVVAAVAEDGQMVILHRTAPSTPSLVSPPQWRYEAVRAGLPPPDVWAVLLMFMPGEGQRARLAGISSDGRFAGVLIEPQPSPLLPNLGLYDTMTGQVVREVRLPVGFSEASLPAFVEIVAAVGSIEFQGVTTDWIGQQTVTLCYDDPRDRFVVANGDSLAFIPRPPAKAGAISFLDLGIEKETPASMVCDPTDGAIFTLSTSGMVRRFSVNGDVEQSRSFGFPLGFLSSANALGDNSLSLPEGTGELLVSGAGTPADAVLILNRRTLDVEGYTQRAQGWGDTAALAAGSGRIWGVVNGEELVLNDARSGLSQLALLDEARSFTAMPSADGRVAGFMVAGGRGFPLLTVRLIEAGEEVGSRWLRLQPGSGFVGLQPLPPVAPDGLRLSADGGEVLVRSRDGRVYHGKTAFDANGLETMEEGPFASGELCCLNLEQLATETVVMAELLPDGSAAVLALADHRIVLADLGVGTQRVLGHMGGPVRSLAVAPDGQSIAVLAEGGVPVVIAVPGPLRRLLPNTLVHRPWAHPEPLTARYSPALPGLPDGVATDVILAAAFPVQNLEAATDLATKLTGAGLPARVALSNFDLLVLVPMPETPLLDQHKALIRVRRLSPALQTAGLHVLQSVCPRLAEDDTLPDPIPCFPATDP